MALSLSFIAALATNADAQTNIKKYYVNDGRSNTYEADAAETQVDVGGFVPYARYSDNQTGGHHYAATYDPGNWPAKPFASFLELVKNYGLDLYKLDNALDNTLGAPDGILPFNTATLTRAEIDTDYAAMILALGGSYGFPIRCESWWTCTGTNGMPGTGKRNVLMWPYKINGGPVMICMAADDAYNLARPPGDPAASILLVNYPFHWRHLGTNKNRWRDVDGWPRQFSGPATGAFMTYDGGRYSNGTEVLGMQAQAIEAGDIVVYVGENISNNLWITIQRTQEAEAFVRSEWSTVPIPSSGLSTWPPIPVDKSYLDGLSWGQLSSGTMSFLQPAIYSGTAAWNISDFGYAQTEYYDLQSDLSAAIGHAGWLPSTDPIWTSQFLMVDVLGIRFDDPAVAGQGWDLAGISMNRRPGDLHVPVLGRVGDNEFNYPMHWPSEDDTGLTFGANAAFLPKLMKNWEHDPTAGFIAGKHEFAAWDGGEWNSLKGAGVTPAATNAVFPPAGTAPTNPYPDPYTHTLRHVHVDPSPNPAILTQLDAQSGITPIYRSPAGEAGGTIKTIGHGTWIGFHDNMHVLDLDGDGHLEVVFANFEGYVHILEFHSGGYSNWDPVKYPGGDPTVTGDAFRLYDEWKSPYLGRGIIGADCIFAGSLAQMFFGTSNGEVFRIDAQGANTYAVANGGAPIVSAMSGTLPLPPYPGPTPIISVGDFAGSSARELLVVNRMLDWSLYNLSGGLLISGKLFRTTHAVGPTDAFPALMPPTGSAPDTNRELLVSASDGHVWWLDWLTGAGAVWDDELDPALPFTNLSLFKVVPVNFNGPGSPSHLLLFGRNDDRDDDADFDGFPDGNPDAIQLWDLTSQTLVNEVSSSLPLAFDGFDAAMSFAWIVKPSASAMAHFVIGTGKTLQTFRMTVNGIMSDAAVEVYPPAESEAARYTNCITSVDVPLNSSGEGSALFFGDCRGRVYIMSTGLQFVRNGAADFNGIVLPLPPSNYSGALAARPSNRSLGGNYAFCAEDHASLDGGGTLYFADYVAPAYIWSHSGTPPPGTPSRIPVYQVGGVDFGATGTNAWQPFLAGANTVLEAHNETPWDLNRPDHNRTLIYRDLDDGKPGGDSDRELEIFAETGTAYYDDAAGLLRRFQTASFDPKFLGSAAPSASLSLFWGGRVFEHPSRYPTTGSNKDYNYLGGFTIPVDAIHHTFNGSTEGWWYPSRSPTEFLSGQIESHWQSVHSQGLGTSMKVAMLRYPGSGTAVAPHVVVGTNGGFVYAIRPGTPLVPPANGEVVSTLTYASEDLGSFIIGLDCKDLNGDGSDEIVCGSWIDDGSYDDWVNMSNRPEKNRGQLTIIDLVAGTSTALPGDSNFATLRTGLGASVFGVKIDDVNNDGTDEIWCTDQFHVYLFYKDSSGNWKIAMRSADLGCFPGMYNNLFPIKDEDGKTVKLVVVSPGYVMEFGVDPNLVP